MITEQENRGTGGRRQVARIVLTGVGRGGNNPALFPCSLALLLSYSRYAVGHASSQRRWDPRLARPRRHRAGAGDLPGLVRLGTGAVDRGAVAAESRRGEIPGAAGQRRGGRRRLPGVRPTLRPVRRPTSGRAARPAVDRKPLSPSALGPIRRTHGPDLAGKLALSSFQRRAVRRRRPGERTPPRLGRHGPGRQRRHPRRLGLEPLLGGRNAAFLEFGQSLRRGASQRTADLRPTPTSAYRPTIPPGTSSKTAAPPSASGTLICSIIRGATTAGGRIS